VNSQRRVRSKSPFSVQLNQRSQTNQSRLLESPSKTSELSHETNIGNKSAFMMESGTPSDYFNGSKKTSKSLHRKPEQKDELKPSKLACFEIANFTLPDLTEKIVFVKFLDDNDPRLLFLVTYNEQLKTTYMKVLKIEKSRKFYERKITQYGGITRNSVSLT